MWVYHRTKNFLQDKISPNPPTITEIVSRIIFHPCSKDHHRLYVIINTGQKIPGIKILPMTVTMA